VVKTAKENVAKMFYPTGLLWAAINTRIDEAAREAAREVEGQSSSMAKVKASTSEDAASLAENLPPALAEGEAKAVNLHA